MGYKTSTKDTIPNLFFCLDVFVLVCFYLIVQLQRIQEESGIFLAMEFSLGLERAYSFQVVEFNLEAGYGAREFLRVQIDI